MIRSLQALAAAFALAAAPALAQEASARSAGPARPGDIELPAPPPKYLAPAKPQLEPPPAPDPAAAEGALDDPEEEVFIPGRRSPALRPAPGSEALPLRRLPPPAPAARPQPAGEADPPEDPDKVKSLVPPPADGEEQILSAWAARRRALDMHDHRLASELEERIAELREELGYDNLFSIGTALAHEAIRQMRFDAADAVRRAVLATTLAPDLPFAHWALARTSWNADPVHIGRPLAALAAAARGAWKEPRWRAAALADLTAGLVIAVLLAGAVSLALIVARRGRYLLHDLLHVLPPGSRAWQAGLLAVVALALPLAFGLGGVAVAAAALAAIWFHASRAERALGAAFLIAAGLLPAVAGLGARLSAFAGTAAETLWLIERGGAEGSRVREALAAWAERPDPPFQVAFALGRNARRRGEVQQAAQWLRRAAELEPGSPEALVELGNALFLIDDVDGAHDAYLRAAERDRRRPEPLFNLFRLHSYLAQGASHQEASAELSRAQEYVHRAIEIDPRLGLAAAQEPDFRANRYLSSIPLPAARIAELASAEVRPAAVQGAVGAGLFGRIPRVLWPLLGPAVVALLALAVFAAGRTLPSSACTKCGRPVCCRCDAEVVGPGLCGQCIHLFRHSQNLDPGSRAEKEQGIQRFQARRDRAVRVCALLLPGSGQVLTGRPFRGALQLGAVVLLVLCAFFPAGAMRPPSGPPAVALRIVPPLVLALGLHALALRQTFNRLRAPSSR